MKNLFFVFVGLLLITSCSQQEPLASQVTANFTSQIPLVSNQKKFSIKDLKGKTYELTDGVLYFFNASHEAQNNFSNALALIPENTKDIGILNDFLSSNQVQLTFDNYYASFRKNNGETLYFIVNNEAGQQMMNDLKDQPNVTLVPGIQLANWYGAHRYDTSNFESRANTNQLTVNNFLGSMDSRFSSGSCNSGGVGATSCSIDDPISGCSVTCSSGYYACCSGGSNICTCIKETGNER